MLRFISIALLCLSFTSASQAYDEDGNYAVWGLGKKSCFKYSQAREKNEYDDFSNYIKGFLTAYNMIEEETYSISSAMPFKKILEWLDDECELKQVHPLEHALLAFIDAHYDKRLKKAKSGSGIGR